MSTELSGTVKNRLKDHETISLRLCVFAATLFLHVQRACRLDAADHSGFVVRHQRGRQPHESVTSSTPGFYYVDAQKRRHGQHPWDAGQAATNHSTLPAGSVVELHGTYDTGHNSPATIVAQGTSARPVFIRGVSPTSRPLARRQWELKGTYLIVENVEFGPTSDLSNTGSIVILLPASHVVVRNSDLHGTPNDGGLGVLNWEVGYGELPAGVVTCITTMPSDNGDLSTFDRCTAFPSATWQPQSLIFPRCGDGIQSMPPAAHGVHAYLRRPETSRTTTSRPDSG